MLTIASYALVAVTIIIGFIRCYRDRKSPNRYKAWVRDFVGVATVLMVYIGAWLVGVHLYVQNTESVTPVYQVAKLEPIMSTSLITEGSKEEEVPDVFVQVTKSDSPDQEAPEYLAVKTHQHRYRIPIHSTMVDYREKDEAQIVVKAMVMNSTPISRLLHVNGKVKSVTYHLFIPRDSIDMVSSPVPEDFARYPVPRIGKPGVTTDESTPC